MNTILLSSVQELMLRDLNKLRLEISAYPSDDKLWLLAGDIKNPAGNLCLHLCGNLQHYIGAVLGKSDYVRNRDAEFNTRGLSKDVLIEEINATLVIVSKTLSTLNLGTLVQEYSENVFNKPMTTGYFLIHLAGHLNYHLGQVNYHRRLITSQ
jgi:uncharacterized damage-inducible protein DinB